MIDEKKLVGVEKKLVEKLREIYDNDHFVIWVRACLKTDEERQVLFQSILSGEIKNSDDISLYALDIHNQEENQRSRLSKTA